MTTMHTALPVDSVGGFLDALAAKVPAPGGGATAALHLGQAAALVSMVARYTTASRAPTTSSPAAPAPSPATPSP